MAKSRLWSIAKATPALEDHRRSLSRRLTKTVCHSCTPEVIRTPTPRDSLLMNSKYTSLREKVASCLVQVLTQVCGGTEGVDGCFDQSSSKLRETVVSSIAFPNKDPSSTEGKAHDIEIRLALSLFHRWKRKQSKNSFLAISDFGLKREITSPRQFAEIIAAPFESLCQKDDIGHDVRVQTSGIICIVTSERSQLLRQVGKLPCPHCVQWFAGEKGLWWHQQQKHKVEYSEAAAVAAASTNQLALIPYDPQYFAFVDDTTSPCTEPHTLSVEGPFEHIKKGDLDSLKKAAQQGAVRPAQILDRRGASPLMWAAGGGFIDIVRYLVEHCGCDPNQGQRGKRSFSGRTALHWAARNGHLQVTEYLVNVCGVDLEAATIDGTTAFGWACWQGHLPIMQFLCEKGSNIHRTNSFGCNAVLWCAQGNGDISRMKWLQDMGCDMVLVNNNRHGVVHKAAQRGQHEVCVWFFEEYVFKLAFKAALKLVGPDSEGYCPSDLAGMEGYEKLAKWLASNEMALIERLRLFKAVGEPGKGLTKCSKTSWLYETESQSRLHLSERDHYVWEKYGGIRRMRSKLKEPL